MPAAALISALTEHSLNAWLKQSQHQQKVPTGIINKQFSLYISDLNLQLTFISSAAGKITVLSSDERADCKLSSDLASLKKLENSNVLHFAHNHSYLQELS